MYAVIKTGGKQYKVAKDDLIEVEKLPAATGDTVRLDHVLMLGGKGAPAIGTPRLEGAHVTAEVVDQTRGGKIVVFKKKRRKNYRRKAGHRQDITVLRIKEISANGAAPKAATAKKSAKPKAAATADGEEA